ncbi:transcriptional regulator [Phyllobacterium phragmitis]|uniref:Transcriptional regulator n=1 Tax=Phyllobacterium phragmitis TaxID=2670329 RepID=A0A2S9IYQ2_9HYPH|nr:LacI family DNA-binding transcriptional regulator [Phyllobacterium phragmitis]PRD45659.1 transcriptional regulator [Phyllobacterium phragmitis]
MDNERRASGEPTFDDVVRIPSTADATWGDPESVVGTALIEDVARLAGVAPITVSRAIRQPGKVSAEKRERIRLAISQTGYKTNPHASALRSGRTNIVLAFVSNLFSQQFALAVRGCAQVLEKAGYQFLVGQTSYSYSKETAIIQSLQALKPAAVMFTGVIELERNRESLRSLDIPIMETWAYPRDPIDLLVGFSNTDAGRMAANHLADRGYRRVAYIGRRGGRGALRLKGFREVCAERGLDFKCEIVCDEVESVSDGRRSLARLFDQTNDIDAVFCANDLLAIGALMEARRRKLTVPSDLAIIGFGENDMAGELSPGLTTIAIDSFALGQFAGEMLMQRLSGEPVDHPARHVELTLIERGSA